MRNEAKIQEFKQKSIEELQEILNNTNSSETDIVVASFELGEKEEKLGIAEYYTTEEVLENIFGGRKVAQEC